MLRESHPAHHYRAPLNPEMVKRVNARRREEARIALAAAVAESRRLEQDRKRLARELAERETVKRNAQALADLLAYKADLEDANPLPRRPSREIIEEVGARYGCTFREIVGVSRNRQIVAVRHLAIRAVADARQDLSTVRIGRIFGGRDHSTIIYALSKTRKPGQVR